MSINTIKTLIVIVSVIIMLLISKSILSLFTERNKKLDKKRESQLKFSTKRNSSQEMTTEGLINTISTPVKKYIMPKLEINESKMDKLNKDIQLANWKGFDAYTFTALDITLKIIGIVFGLIFITKSTILALIWFLVPFVGFKFLFKNSISNRKYNLMSEFPDFIRITQGFLSSNMPLVDAIENALPYVGPTWRPILKEFVVTSNVKSQEDCIEELKDKVPIFEVHELWSLIQLNIEQGIDIKESFNNQALKVKEMQKEVMLGKINKRQIMATLIQAPLMLCMIMGFGLPTFSSMINLDF